MIATRDGTRPLRHHEFVFIGPAQQAELVAQRCSRLRAFAAAEPPIRCSPWVPFRRTRDAIAGCRHPVGADSAGARAVSDEWANNSKQADPNFRWPGGESYREFRERILRTTEDIA
jgi:hypothetical protein